MRSRILDKFKRKPPNLPLIIAHKTTDFSMVDKKHIVVLSPAFYWYKRSDLAFKNLKTAKKVAKSIFFGWIPDGEYSYYAFKESDGFGFIAFDAKKVLLELESLGLDPKYIDRILFAQSAINRDIKDIKISENLSLKYIDSSFVVVPTDEISSDLMDIKDLDFTVSFTPSMRSSSILDKKLFITISLILLFFIVGFVLDLMQKNSLIDSLQNEKEALITKSKLPATTMQLNSIYKRLESVRSDQILLRENLSKLLSINIHPALISELKVTDKSIVAVIETKGLDNEAKTAQQIKKEFIRSTVATKNSTLAVEIKW